MSEQETIAAVATAPGRGGIGIVRVSGAQVTNIARSLLGRVPHPRSAEFHTFRDVDSTAIDRGLALFFPAPRSYTGEDVIELQGHGGPVVLDRLLARVLALGARHARPGEFTERAFLNGKLDLTQAEAVADLIDSASVEAARSAMRSLQGEFSVRVGGLVARLTELRVYVEAALDFPDEEIDLLATAEVRARIDELQTQLTDVLETASAGATLREGIKVVIAGRPNVGKSSLLNQLSQREAAIVTDIPGTTRDPLREYILIDGMPVHIVDTAGLHAGGDAVEREGMRRARGEFGDAQAILVILDDALGIGEEDQRIIDELPTGVRTTFVFNKSDLSGREPEAFDYQRTPAIRLSAKTGAGLALLRRHLAMQAGYQGNEGLFSARRRHVQALQRAKAALAAGERVIGSARLELLAEELRVAQEVLGEITGAVTSDDLLGEIFAGFCIGK